MTIRNILTFVIAITPTYNCTSPSVLEHVIVKHSIGKE